MDWQSIIALAAMAIASLGFLERRFDKSLSIREHEEYKDQEKQKDALRDKIVDMMAAQVRILEQTRPTGAELQSKIDNMKEQLGLLRERKD